MKRTPLYQSGKNNIYKKIPLNTKLLCNQKKDDNNHYLTQMAQQEVYQKLAHVIAVNTWETNVDVGNRCEKSTHLCKSGSEGILTTEKSKHKYRELCYQQKVTTAYWNEGQCPPLSPLLINR